MGYLERAKLNQHSHELDSIARDLRGIKPVLEEMGLNKGEEKKLMSAIQKMVAAKYLLNDLFETMEKKKTLQKK